MRFLEKLQSRWKLKSIGQVIIVLIVFSLTGSTVLLIKKPIMKLISQSGEYHSIFNVLYYVFMIPMYYAILMCYGFIFGQFDFFWGFSKKTWGRITRRKAKTADE